MPDSDRQGWQVILHWDDKQAVLSSSQQMINLLCLLHLFRLFW